MDFFLCTDFLVRMHVYFLKFCKRRFIANSLLDLGPLNVAPLKCRSLLYTIIFTPSIVVTCMIVDGYTVEHDTVMESEVVRFVSVLFISIFPFLWMYLCKK